MDHALKTARHLMTCFTVGFGLYLIRAAISDFAGQVTLADIVLSLWVSTRARDWIAVPCVVFSLTFGVCQWYLRKRTIRQFSHRRVCLEWEVGLARESSQLTETGDTRPADR